MLTYREHKDNLKNELVNPYLHLKQSGLNLGMRGAKKLGGIVDVIIDMAANKDIMLRKIITYLKAAVKGEPNEAEMIAQLNNAYNILVQATRQQQQQQPPLNPNA
jgi:hypothetical protein